MVTKSIYSSPPRVRGGEPPIDVQEIEVELASTFKTQYKNSSNTTNSGLTSLASNDKDGNPNPAASTTSSSARKIRSLSIPRTSEQPLPIDRQPPKEQRQWQPQKQTMSNQTTPERTNVSKEQRSTVPKKGEKAKEECQPSVVEVQLSDSPKLTHKSFPLAKPSPASITTTASTTTTTSTNKQSAAPLKQQRATSLPAAKTTVPAAAAAAAVVVSAATAVSALTSTSTTTTNSQSKAKTAAARGVRAASPPKATTTTAAATVAASAAPGGRGASPTKTTTIAAAAASNAPPRARTASPTKMTAVTATATVPRAQTVSPTKTPAVPISRPATPVKTTIATATSQKTISASSATATATTPRSLSASPPPLTAAASAASGVSIATASKSIFSMTVASRANSIKTTTSMAAAAGGSANRTKATAATATVAAAAVGASAANLSKSKATTKPVVASATPTYFARPPPVSKNAENRKSPVFRYKNHSRGDDLVVVRDGKLCHVRLTLAFLTGVTAERLPENFLLHHHNDKKNGTTLNGKVASNSPATIPEELLPLGFAMLSNGDGTMAVSHPLKSFEFGSGVPRQTLIWTDNADVMSSAVTQNSDDLDSSVDHDDNESQLTHSAGQRRLYFEVSLNRETDNSVSVGPPTEVPEDDATAKEMLKEVAANYSPELVPIVVGLKKGDDQVLPLGIATLVVSGREVRGQHVDLPVRSLTVAERDAYCSDPLHKKPKKPSFRLFGGGKRLEAPAASGCFKKEHRRYNLAPNATLRVRLDVRSGMYAEHGPALWGDLLILRSDDQSRGTVTVYDMSTQNDREVVQRSLPPLDDRHEYVEVLPNANGTTIISSPGGALNSSGSPRQQSKLQGRDDESHQTRFEVTSIFAGSTEMRSTSSHSLNMTLFERLESAGICGALDKLGDGAISSSQSFASTLADADPPDLESAQSAASVGDTLLPDVLSSTSKMSKANSRGTFLSGTTGPTRGSTNRNTLDDDDDYDEDAYGGAASTKSSGADSSTEGGTRTSLTTRSVGDETYEKVREAKRTLLRYASRVGVEMEDLLIENDEDESTTFHRRESSSYSGSSTYVSK